LLLESAAEEARRRGDRRLGTDHLLLGLLHDPVSAAARALQVDLDAARTSADALDRAAMAAVGIEVDHLGQLNAAAPFRRLPPLTSGARAVLKSTIDTARPSKTGRIETHHFLLALLDRKRPDPAAQLLEALGVDPAATRGRLDEFVG